MTMPATKECHLCGFARSLESFNPKRKECKQCSKGIKLIYYYGITRKQYDVMLAAQEGSCAICPYVPAPDEMLAVDHNHKCCPGRRSCGKCLRSLLCDKCNRGLGFFDDSIERLMAAAKYIKLFERSVVS